MNFFFYSIFSFICKNCKQIYLMSQQVLRSNNELFMHFDLIKIFDLIICRLMCQQLIERGLRELRWPEY